MTFLDNALRRVPVADISARARAIRFWPTVLLVLAALLFGVGWLAAKTFAVLWLALAWTAVAVKVGWQEGCKPSRG